MKKIVNISILAMTVLSLAGCWKSSTSDKTQTVTTGGDATTAETEEVSEDILVGVLDVAVDESVYPLLKEQEAVFLSAYPNARLNFLVRPELFAVRDLLGNEARVAILSRKLTEEENDYFLKRSIKPRIFPVWTDALVLIGNTKQADTTVTMEYLFDAMGGKSVDRKKIVFDNLNGSAFRQLKEKGNLEKVSSAFVEEAKGMEAVLQTVADDPDKIGVLGYDAYLDLIASFSDKEAIRVLRVGGYKPSQSTIAAEEYPLTRTFYVLNYQPNLGLGLGFSAFLTGDRGQRIVLKSGLVPATMPGREIIIRDEVPL